MGRIKSTLVKRTAHQLVKHKGDSFTPDFEHNKKMLADTMPSKKMRNKIAGYLSRLSKVKSTSQNQ
ncbi:30S ribosomal protein S17e [Candidatus Pacearchaeota archaeon CG10_big_fil_rev_8_21_14_0_10_34_76]|nr:MAG: 30S ribosomal protein S17e [Candidatus Pacearchaeota archaeon CG10_big_fil_rev_8_21_14_0_10_34_76]